MERAVWCTHSFKHCNHSSYVLVGCQVVGEVALRLHYYCYHSNRLWAVVVALPGGIKMLKVKIMGKGSNHFLVPFALFLCGSLTKEPIPWNNEHLSS